MAMNNSLGYWQQQTATVLVTFNRPDHTAQVLDSLRRDKIDHLIVMCDAPRSVADEAAVKQVRSLIQAIDWTVPTVVVQDTNQGLARSILQGVHLAFKKYEAVVLLEDDCVPQPYFFHWVYSCLEKYRNVSEVCGISGYSIPIPENIRKDHPFDAYFVPRMGSWGWATWKSRWQTDVRNLARLTLKCLEQGIDLEQGGTDVPNAIGDVLTGRVRDTWTLPWLVNVYLHGGCYVYPTISHIDNIGMDGTGVHCGKTNKYDTHLNQEPSLRLPDTPIANPAIKKIFLSYYQAFAISYSNVQLMEIAKKHPLKVVHISTHDHGGAGIAALRLHQGMLQIGIDSKMLVLSKRSEDPRIRSIGSIDTALRSWNALAAAYPSRRSDLEIFTDSQCPIRLDDFQEFRDADVVQLHWVAGMLDFSALSEMLNGKPCVWTMHDMNAFTGGCHYNWECRKFETGCGACTLLNSTDTRDISHLAIQAKQAGYSQAILTLVSPSEWLAAEARKSLIGQSCDVQVIANGFPLNVFQPYDRNSIRLEMGIALDRPVVLFGCDSLANPRKGFRYLMDAARILQQDGGISPLFCFFGHMPPNLAFPGDSMPLGNISDPNMLAAMYSMADVFVITSLQDNLPNVVPECLACGTPVAGFSIGGIPDMIQHQRTGYLVDNIAASELAQGIRWTLENTNSAMRMRCRLFAESRFALDIQSSKYEALFHDLLTKSEARNSDKLQAPEKHKTVLVNLGCGSRFHSDWHNFDLSPAHPSVQQANLSSGIPLPSEQADVVYHSHILELFTKAQAPNFIADCYRVLRVGGILRVVIPDLEAIARLYLENLELAQQGNAQAEDRYDWMMLEMFDQTVRNREGGAMLDWWIAPELKAQDFIIERCGDEVRRVLSSLRNGHRMSVRPEPTDPGEIGKFRLGGEVHQWMYDRFSLGRLLKNAGFRNIRVVQANESAIPNFASYCLDTDQQGNIRKPDSLFMEAIK